MHVNFTLFLVIFGVLLAIPVHGDYFDFNANGTLFPGGNLTLYGESYMGNGSYMNGSEMRFYCQNYTDNWVNISDNTTGHFSMNFTIPHDWHHGEYNFSIMMGTMNKTVPLFITNVSKGDTWFLTKLPPYDEGDTFLINVTIWDEDLNVITTILPVVEIFATNGQKQAWTIINTTKGTGHDGNVTFNITVASGATGMYIIDVERGRTQTPIYVRSGYVMSVETQTELNESRSDYYPGSNFSIIAKIRTTNGDPITDAGNVTAYVTLPNGTLENVTLEPDSTRSGYYLGTYFTNDSLNNTGSHDVKVEADVVNNEVESTFSFTTKAVKVTLKKQEEFFHEWGGSAAFASGEQAGLNILVTNLNNDSIIPGTIDQATFENGGYVNCTGNGTISIKLENAVNGSEVALTGASYDAGGTLFGTTICRMLFTAPTRTGLYKMTINTTVNTDGAVQNITETGVGYFQVQNYVLKSTAMSEEGDGFMTMVYPGENVTFELSAYNLISQQELPGSNITDIKAVSLTPLQFTGGSETITNFTTTNVTLGDFPSITITAPENVTGPLIFKIIANITNNETINETVTGESFFVAKYIMGFLSPMAGGTAAMGGGGGGGGPGMGGPMSGGHSSCSGIINFTGSVFDIKAGMGSGSGAQGVTINGILEARQEMTGTDVSSYITLTNGGSSNTVGTINASLTFDSSYSFSEFYFIILNVSYQGKQDMLPISVMCKRLSFWPNTIGNDGNSQWRFDPNKPVNISISSITKISDGTIIENGTLRLVRGMSFIPGSGPRFLTPNGTVAINFTQINSSDPAMLTIYPTNISKAQWPNGFLDLTFEVCPNPDTYGSGLCDTGWAGMNVIAYDMQIWDAPWGQTLASGASMSLKVAVATNVSRSIDGGLDDHMNWTTSGFSVKIGRPWEGNMLSVGTINATLITDSWSHKNDSESGYWWDAFEIWNVSFTIPPGVKRGENSIMVEVNSSKGEKATQDIWITISKYIVRVPSSSIAYIRADSCFNISDDGAIGNHSLNNTVRKFNLANITATHGIHYVSDTVCFGQTLNTSEGNIDNPPVNYTNPNTNRSWIIVDTAIDGPNTFDTMIIRTDNISVKDYYQVLNKTNRNLTDFYLWQIAGNFSIATINASFFAGAPSSSGGGYYYGTSTWLGSQTKAKNVTIPYIVSFASSNAPAPGLTVSLGGAVKQHDTAGSGASGGFGMEQRIKNLDSTSAVTDKYGVAVIDVNLSSKGSGSYGLFWQLVNGSERTKADWQSISQIALRSFSSYGYSYNYDSIANLTENRTFMVCASTFGATGSGIEGANVTISGTTWQMMGGSITQNLVMFHPDSTNSTVNSVLYTDADGCVNATVVYDQSTGWPEGHVEIKATVGYGGETETVNVGYAWRPYASDTTTTI